MQSGGGSFFGRRKGKSLKPSRREALETTLPALLIDLSRPPPENLSGLFSVSAGEVFLEIGFGGGEHLLNEARRLPQTGFIGVEPFQNGMAKAVSIIRRDGIRNVRLFDRDAVLLLDWLPESSLLRIDLLYPDPWPKLRHWKRRFVNAGNLARIARCLAPDGVFRFASDVEAYVKWTLREVERSGKLEWIEGGIALSRAPWPDWPGTRYEAKAIAEGRSPTYLTFRKV
jgi:tRNA (guanine-N7-)-methyltransferase